MWKLPVLEARSSAGAAETDLVLVFQEAGNKPIRPKGPYSELVERFRKGDVFTGKTGVSQFVRFGGKGEAQNVLFVGLGQDGALTPEKLRMAAGSAWSKLSAEKTKSVAVSLDNLGLKSELTSVQIVRALAEGMILNCYQFAKYKSNGAGTEKSSKEKPSEYSGPTKITFISKDKNLQKELNSALEEVTAIGEAVNVTRDWSNEPSNYGTPEYYASEAQRLAKAYGLKCTILGEKDAEKEKMGLFLGVGQGSEREGKIVILEYTPVKATNPKTLAFVGKGVTFDSGGISIKPSLKMEEMKHDMTGAATVMGAMLLLSKWKVPNRVVGIMAFTENMPSGNAIQPGNVLNSRAGKTVEIFNTDAEGRLILADVLDYAHNYKPDAIIDAATLTGAVSIALGKLCGAVLGNDDDLIQKVRQAGEVNGERIWQLPLFDEYFEDMKSEVADMKNSVNDPNGGVIRGAIFLKQFIRKGVPWAHLDIAATSYNLTHIPYLPKRGASGTYVRTLAQLAADYQ